MLGGGAAGMGQWESGGGLGRVKSAVFLPEGHKKPEFKGRMGPL